MKISIKTDQEIAIMRESGKILNAALQKVARKAMAGVTTEELDQIAKKTIEELGGEPAFLGYKGYPKTLCASINNEVVHGIPRSDRVLKEGDIVGLDLGVRLKGFYTDKAVTVGVGKISKEAQRLLDVTRGALDIGIEELRDWDEKSISHISRAVQTYLEKNKFSVVRDLVGHGIGRELHEDPQVPNFENPKKFPEIALQKGMVIAIEPMVIAHPTHWKVKFLDDGWTVQSADGSLAAHFEDTLAITANGYEILTR